MRRVDGNENSEHLVGGYLCLKTRYCDMDIYLALLTVIR
jgi:hypothetical protein